MTGEDPIWVTWKSNCSGFIQKVVQRKLSKFEKEFIHKNVSHIVVFAKNQKILMIWIVQEDANFERTGVFSRFCL